jgi:hypothetical protein
MNGPRIPTDYPRIRAVDSFAALVATPWSDGVNALCWPRSLPGDFGELVALASRHPVTRGAGAAVLDAEWLSAAQRSGLQPGGRAAVAVLLNDLAQLKARGLEPELNFVRSYDRDLEAQVLPTDVYSFHVDSAPVPTDTWLCTYYGAPSEGLRNEEAMACVDIPTTRGALLEAFGGPDNAAFRAHLRERSYDLHYAPLPGAQPFCFGVGALWRVAVQWPGCAVPPCIHRAPDEFAGPRLLLIC